MSKEEKIVNRRDFLFTATYTVGAVGVGAVIWPMIDQMNPDKAQQALATTEVDISNIEPGKSITVLWRGKPVFLKRRTQDEIAEARAVNLDDLPDPQKDEDRVKEGKDEWLVMLGVCTHLGCVPLKDKGDFNNSLNIPLPAGTNSEEYFNAFDRVLERLINYKPDFLIFSAGFDAHKDDPLAQFKLNSKDFYQITRRTLAATNKFTKGKVVSILEGGYDLNALSESANEHVNALVEFN